MLALVLYSGVGKQKDSKFWQVHHQKTSDSLFTSCLHYILVLVSASSIDDLKESRGSGKTDGWVLYEVCYSWLGKWLSCVQHILLDGGKSECLWNVGVKMEAQGRFTEATPLPTPLVMLASLRYSNLHTRVPSVWCIGGSLFMSVCIYEWPLKSSHSSAMVPGGLNITQNLECILMGYATSPHKCCQWKTQELTSGLNNVLMIMT